MDIKPIFKAFLIILAVVLLSQCERDEPSPQINFPDKNFLNALIEQRVDKNGDGKISIAEAEVKTSLYIWSYSISDMTGIDKFIKLEILCCNDNKLTTLDISNNTALKNLCCEENLLTALDVSNNTALEQLSCGHNKLTALDVSNNTFLESLNCWVNQLTILDVSYNTELRSLHCDVNQLTTLDVTNNIALETLSCGRNQLTVLDVSNNSALNSLNISEMPSLYKVCVWILPFPPTGVNVEKLGSPNVYYTTDCSK